MGVERRGLYQIHKKVTQKFDSNTERGFLGDEKKDGDASFEEYLKFSSPLFSLEVWFRFLLPSW